MAKIQLRPARLRDLFFLLKLRNLPEVVALSRSKHRARPRWFTQVRKRLQVVEIDGERAGYVILTPLWEVSLVLSPEIRGQGHGPAVLKRLDGPLLARIRPENAVSIRAFQKAGFSQEDMCQVFFREGL